MISPFARHTMLGPTVTLANVTTVLVGNVITTLASHTMLAIVPLANVTTVLAGNVISTLSLLVINGTTKYGRRRVCTNSLEEVKIDPKNLLGDLLAGMTFGNFSYFEQRFSFQAKFCILSKYISYQSCRSAERNSNTSETGSVRISARGRLRS